MLRNFCVVGVLILSLCSAGAASALPLDPEMAEAAGGASLLSGLWDRFLAWIEGREAEGGEGPTLLQMEGCHIDPNGTWSCGGGGN